MLHLSMTAVGDIRPSVFKEVLWRDLAEVCACKRGVGAGRGAGCFLGVRQSAWGVHVPACFLCVMVWKLITHVSSVTWVDTHGYIAPLPPPPTPLLPCNCGTGSATAYCSACRERSDLTGERMMEVYAELFKKLYFQYMPYLFHTSDKHPLYKGLLFEG